MTLKVWVHIDSGDGAAPQRVGWYLGTSDLMLENAIRMHLHLPRHSRFLLRDVDGDLVPVSATLPHDHTFHLVLVDNGNSPPTATATDGSLTVRDVGQPPRPRRKRRRAEQRVAAAHDNAMMITDAVETRPDHSSFLSASVHQHSPFPIAASTTSPLRPRSMVYLVTRFLETFTCAISNDDNVNFIPSTGPYALYALYCHLFPDSVYHPRSPNGFYKMTSMQGKIDRQRVIRYYRGSTSRTSEATAIQSDDESYEYVVSKPEGKGPLLRKYVEVGTDVAAADLVRAASFVHALDLDPQVLVAQYTRFLEGFLPISKADFQAHTKASDQHHD